MNINQLTEKDSSFSETSFISKVDNTFVMYLTAISTNNLPRVKHKIGEELYNETLEIIKGLDKQNLIQMYDELNVKETKIIDISEIDNFYIINVKLTSKYLDYKIDKLTGNYVSGNNKSRIELDNYLTFAKYKNTQQHQIISKCPGCGVNIDYNNTGICSYCNTTYNLEDYDWIMINIKQNR